MPGCRASRRSHTVPEPRRSPWVGPGSTRPLRASQWPIRRVSGSSRRVGVSGFRLTSVGGSQIDQRARRWATVVTIIEPVSRSVKIWTRVFRSSDHNGTQPMTGGMLLVPIRGQGLPGGCGGEARPWGLRTGPLLAAGAPQPVAASMGVAVIARAPRTCRRASSPPSRATRRVSNVRGSRSSTSCGFSTRPGCTARCGRTSPPCSR